MEERSTSDVLLVVLTQAMLDVGEPGSDAVLVTLEGVGLGKDFVSWREVFAVALWEHPGGRVCMLTLTDEGAARQMAEASPAKRSRYTFGASRAFSVSVKRTSFKAFPPSRRSFHQSLSSCIRR